MTKQKLDRAAFHIAHLLIIDVIPVLQRPVDKRTPNFERRYLVRVEVGIQEGTRATGGGSEQQVLADLVVVVGQAVGVLWPARRQQQSRCLDGLAGNNKNLCADDLGRTRLIIVICGDDPTACIAVQAIDMRVRPDVAISGSNGTIQQRCS